MPPKAKACSCKSHSAYSAGQSFTVCRIDSRNYAAHIVTSLRDNRDISNRSVYLCSACVDFDKQHLVASVTPAKKTNVVDASVVTVIDNLNSDRLSTTDKLTLYQSLGEHLSTDLSNDAVAISQVYKDIDSLSTFDSAEWVRKRNDCLVSFLTAACNVQIHDASAKTLASFVKAIEHLLFCRKSNIITPLYYVLASASDSAEDALLVLPGYVASFQRLTK
jgi:hypothetical protein